MAQESILLKSLQLLQQIGIKKHMTFVTIELVYLEKITEGLDWISILESQLQ